MKRPSTHKMFFVFALLLLILGASLSILSIFSVDNKGNENRVIIQDSFRLTSMETLRYGIGSLRGGENVSLSVQETETNPFNFSIVTYGGLRYFNSANASFVYSFVAGADYYEAVFTAYPMVSSTIAFHVALQSPKVAFPFSWLSLPAKILFFASWACFGLILLQYALVKNPGSGSKSEKLDRSIFSRKGNLMLRFERIDDKVNEFLLLQNIGKIVLVGVLLSLVLWLLVLSVNNYPLGTLENWYTDHVRHPYSAALFLKDGFSVFSTPLGKLASVDNSYFKYVTWPEMPNLYPLGSIFLFSPFAYLLESGSPQNLVFKTEIALFLIAAHICLYYFLKSFVKLRMNFPLKFVTTYLLYIVLVVYSANGMFDAIALGFSIAALSFYLKERYDYFLLLIALSITLQYQAGLFLFPLILLGLVKFIRQSGFSKAITNKVFISAAALLGIDSFTAYLSLPFLVGARPEFIMNGIDLFSPHSQIPWALQTFAVFLTLSVTLVLSFYLFQKNRLISISMILVLFPCFTMPYFQPWYLPFFFVYTIVPQQRRVAEITMIWLIFMVLMLSFGGLSYNPLQVLNNVRNALRLP